jgi:hypothetical protein
MSEYELVKKLGSYENFKSLKSMAKLPRHKLFAQNKLSAPTVLLTDGRGPKSPISSGLFGPYAARCTFHKLPH